MLRIIALFITHTLMLAIGFALGVYFLPVLTAPESPTAEEIASLSQQALYKTQFRRDLKGNDFLHWGEGEVSISPRMIVHNGKLAPGPDYKLYLAKEFIEDERSFLQIKDQSVRLGDVKTFDGFVVGVPTEIDIQQYNTVIVWCEAFGEFITAAKYR